MNVLDRAIAAFSPRWAFFRENARRALEELQSYNAARQDRFKESWAAINSTAEQTDSSSRDILRARARDLERNSDIAKSAVEAIIRNVVGTGITPQAATPNESLNELLEAKWKQWVKGRNCDITEQQTFYELQELALRRKVVDGEILVHPVMNKSGRFPLKLQLIEADMLATELLKAPGSDQYVLSGIEVDYFYKPLNYWFNEMSPDGFSIMQTKSIPAKDIFHLFKKTRANQVRGMSELAAVMGAIKDTEDYLDAELIAARIAASYSIFITKVGGNGMGRYPVSNDGGKNESIKTIKPGMVAYLQPGEKAETANPARASAGVDEFVKIESRKIAAGTGQSYEVLTRDMSQSSYSSARQNSLEDRKTWIPMQKYIIDHLNDPIWELFVQSMVLSGEVKIKDFWADPEKYYAVDWIAPGWTWIDPLKDVKASQSELQTGINTLKQICAEQGKDWREVLRQRAKEKQMAEDLGLTLISDNPIPPKGSGEGAQAE